MKIDIRYINAVQNEGLEHLINDKLHKLIQKFNWITNAIVFLKDEKHPEDKRYKCEIRLSVPGPQIFAESQEVNYKAAINKTVDDLKILLNKHKDNMYHKR